MRNESSEAFTTNEKQWVQGRHKIWETRALRLVQSMRNKGYKACTTDEKQGFRGLCNRMRNKDSEVCTANEKQELWGLYNQPETRGLRSAQPMRNNRSEVYTTNEKQRLKACSANFIQKKGGGGRPEQQVRNKGIKMGYATVSSYLYCRAFCLFVCFGITVFLLL